MFRVPGYAETKLPFILKNEHLEQVNGDGTITIRKVEESAYTTGSSDSLIDGHLHHKTKQPGRMSANV
jgi:hypothetical protein